MSINRYEIRLDNVSGTASTITIPFHMDFHNMDNADIQSTEFIDVEEEKGINNIIDNERYPFYPIYSGSTGRSSIQYPKIIGEIRYNINIYDEILLDYRLMTINDLTITSEDITKRRKSFKKTMLRLNFYDTDDSVTQKLVAREILHLDVDDFYLTSNTMNSSNIVVLPTDQIPLRFVAKSPLTFNRLYSEGFKFYYHKNELPKTLYMKAAILSAKNGQLISLFSPIGISGYNRATNDMSPPKINSSMIVGGKHDFIPVTFSNITPIDTYQYFYTMDNVDGTNQSELERVNSVYNRINLELYVFDR